jgi:hypothetical protein
MPMLEMHPGLFGIIQAFIPLTIIPLTVFDSQPLRAGDSGGKGMQ